MTNLYTPTAYAGSTTTVIGTGNVYVHSIIVPKASANTITFEASDGTDYFVLPSATVAGCYILDAAFTAGLKVTCAGADTGVVTWGQ